MKNGRIMKRRFVRKSLQIKIQNEPKTELPNHYSQAFNRLENIEKRLLKNPEITKSYSETITYL